MTEEEWSEHLGPILANLHIPTAQQQLVPITGSGKGGQDGGKEGGERETKTGLNQQKLV